jgi:hypothetical protein
MEQRYMNMFFYTLMTLSIGVEAESILRKEIGNYFELKEELIGPPKLYIGGYLSPVELDNGVYGRLGPSVLFST